MFFTILDGNRILSDNKLTFVCILERLVGFIYNEVRYFYQRNIQGDITAIYNEDGNLVNILTDPGICLSGYLQH